MASDGFTTCLWFDGRAEEAAQHYVSIFKDGRLGRTVRTPEADPGTPGSVLTVDFEEVDYYWDRLLEGGGQESQCGWLKDKFGVSWQVVPQALMKMIADSDPAKAKRAFDAMMKMVKLDIAVLQKAYAGE